ncbi:flagella synthesis protein FlgN [Shewanella intestini]|uniref:Flagellar protein FlgN n=1 Tax=Shewanella intestini TaxID=2017544 RepID=A0ABS5HY81_9GAMM|nr:MULTISPECIES: flagellar protein FlgN [Shewanella]MBR9726742.1 flagellar protein FlgN [Shewanella intestini]MRG34692.1 flagellar protein FlgN [Shewanella sp. XMDDZSB0408]
MNDIAQILSQQHANLAALKKIISAEKDALVSQDADELIKLAEQKQNYLSQVETNDKTLASHPNKALLSSEPTLVEKVIQAKNLLNECKQLNSQNAKLIELSMASLNRFTQALHASRSASSLTYTDKGKTSSIATLGNSFKA